MEILQFFYALIGEVSKNLRKGFVYNGWYTLLILKKGIIIIKYIVVTVASHRWEVEKC